MDSIVAMLITYGKYAENPRGVKQLKSESTFNYTAVHSSNRNPIKPVFNMFDRIYLSGTAK